MRFWFTTHAVERYVERHAQHLTRAQALAMLKEGAPNAVKLKVKSVYGHTQWKIGDAMVVTKRDPGDDKEVVVTILPARCSTTPNGVPDEEMQMALELIEERGYVTEPREQLHIVPKDPVRIGDSDSVCAHHFAESNTTKAKRDASVVRIVSQVEAAIERQRLKTLEKLTEHDEKKTMMERALRSALRSLFEMKTPEADSAMLRVRIVAPKIVDKLLLEMHQEEWQARMEAKK